MNNNSMRFIPSTVEGIKDFNDEIEEERNPLKLALKELKKAGIDTGEVLWFRPDHAILITEAVNFAAKVIDYGIFYELKPLCIKECINLGASGGWHKNVFYLYHENVGVASFHDPFGHIDVSWEVRWSDGWSGVRRQDKAFKLLIDKNCDFK